MKQFALLAAASATLCVGVASSARAQTSGAPGAGAVAPAASAWQGRRPLGLAHPDWRSGARWGIRRSGRSARHAGPLGVLLSRVRVLDLSGPQREQIRRIVAGALRRRRAAGRPRYGLTVLGDPGSPQYAQAVRDLQTRAAARISRESALATRVYRLLTARQRQELATLLAADRIRMRHFRERMEQLRERMRAKRSQTPTASPGQAPPASSEVP